MSDLALNDLSAQLDTDEVRALVLHLEYPEEIRERKTDQIIAEYRERFFRPLVPSAFADHRMLERAV